jgi:hypothetical protein
VSAAPHEAGEPGKRPDRDRGALSISGARGVSLLVTLRAPFACLRTLPAAALALALAAGCGDLSQEDLLFRAALPSKSEIELVPAGSAAEAPAARTSSLRQAMEVECAELDLRCHAQNVATNLNGLTFGLLDLVDFVVSHPPTTRARGRRVWGPYFDLQSGLTSRFEMLRRDDGVTYDFCLHAVRGVIRDRDARDLSCEVEEDEDSGMILVFSGFFRPGELGGARARTGAGEMILELARIPEMAAAGRRLVFVFDNADERTNIDILLEGSRIPGTVTVREPVLYSYSREADGAGDFLFDIVGNVLDESLRLENLVIEAKWTASQAGRADARITGGDAGPGATVAQCWDEALAEVFSEVNAPPNVVTSGDPGQCAFPQSLLEDAGG